MSSYGVSYKSNVCYPNFTALKFVTILIFMEYIILLHCHSPYILVSLHKKYINKCRYFSS